MKTAILTCWSCLRVQYLRSYSGSVPCIHCGAVHPEDTFRRRRIARNVNDDRAAAGTGERSGMNWIWTGERWLNLAQAFEIELVLEEMIIWSPGGQAASLTGSERERVEQYLRTRDGFAVDLTKLCDVRERQVA